jgi:hypothetical protein
MTDEPHNLREGRDELTLQLMGHSPSRDEEPLTG